MSLTYTPVLSKKDTLIFQYNRHCFINPVRSPPTQSMLQKLSVYPYLYSDSGGYQIYKSKERLRRGQKADHLFVIPGARNQRHKGDQILDPIDLCEKYGALNVKYGFTLDYPLVDGSLEEYTDHLSKSFECAEIMFACRPKLCPETNLFIPLHFSTKEQLHNYFDEMSVLRPDGYGFPVRETTSWDYLLRIAYILVFLHHRGVQKVHMFGSSKREIIILGAVATGLKMFNQMTFDSSTWDTARNVPPKYLNPTDLKQKDIRELKKFRADLPKDLVEQLETGLNKLSRLFFYKLIPLCNIMTINRYTKEVIELASDLKELKCFIRNGSGLNHTSEMLIDAVDILQAGSMRAYRFVENNFDWIWHV